MQLGLKRFLCPGIIVLLSWVHHSACLADELTGRVLDRETRRPIPLVEVRIDEGSPRVTAEDGIFRIAEITEGPHTLTFTHIAYTRKTVEITWPMKNRTLIVALDPFSFWIDEVHIRGEEIDFSLPVQSTSLTREWVGVAAGNIANDPLRTIQAQPSVATDGIDFNSRAAIRGGDPEEQRVYFDGYPLAQYAHHHGFSNLIYDDLLDHTVLIPGGAPLRFRGNLSGVILMSPVRPEADQSFFRIDITSLALGTTQRVSPSLSVLGSIKSSFFNLPVYQQPGILDKSFRDLLARATLGPDEGTQLTATVLGATDRERGDPLFGIENSRKTQSLLAGLRIKIPLGNWTGRVRGYHSYFDSEDDISSPGNPWEHRTHETRLTAELEGLRGPLGLLFSAEVGALNHEGRGGEATDHPLGVSCEGRILIREHSALVLGAGASQEPWTDGLEPEAYGSLSVGLSDRGKVSAGYRRSHQTPFLFSEKKHFASIPIDPGSLLRGYRTSWKDARAVEMDQVSAHSEVRFGKHYAAEGDLYARRYRNLATWEWDSDYTPVDVTGDGAGEGSGYEVAFHRRDPTGLSVSVSFSHSRVRKREGTLSAEGIGDFDLPNAWRLSAVYPLPRDLTFSIAWQDLAGRPYTPLDLNSRAPTEEEINSIRLPRFQRLDVKLQYQYVQKKTDVTIFVDVVNLLDRDNLVMQSAMEMAPGEWEPYRYWGMTFFPIVGCSARW